MERGVYNVATSLFEHVNISFYKQSLKENTGEISTMLHTDFVSNFCLFFEHAFWLDTRRQKKTVCKPRCCQRVAGGDPCVPLLLARMERGAEPAPPSVTTVQYANALFLHVVSDRTPRAVGPGFWQLAPASCIRGSCVLRVQSSRMGSG
jgi:hypothetical protein